MYADSHAHLDYPDFSGILDNVINDSFLNNVKFIVTTGTDIESSIKNIAIAEDYPTIYAAIGVHPHEAGKVPISDISKLKDLIHSTDKIVAIGETGLDYHYDNSPRDLQEIHFRKHIELALESDLPLVLHTRGAEGKCFEIVQEYGVKRCYFHCYTGTVELGLKIAAAGYKIGVTGIVTFNNPSNAELIGALPLNSLLTETDSPFLSPKPFRGKRNEPMRIPVIVEKLKSLFTNYPPEEVERVLYKNCTDFFSFRD
ncbi:MAG: TatD family hydrolase [Fibrobacteres bacterium]|nr:TatD family hydrolase [Fibrobacterota bacterium]